MGKPRNSNVGDGGRFRLTSDGEYHPAETFPLVDGVFIPNNRPDGMQVDSAGHRCFDFANSTNESGGNIWAGGAIPALTCSMPPDVAAVMPALAPDQTLLPTTLSGVDYAAKGRGLIFMPANNGITFDLDAIRKANRDAEPIRFRATAGNTEVASKNNLYVPFILRADLWVLVDGRVRFRRRDFNSCMGDFPIDVSIAQQDRFLTLVATDGGNDIGFDWILFGDPRLELLSAEPADPSANESKDEAQP